MVTVERALNWEVDQLWDLALVQTWTINAQNEVLRNMEAQLVELRVMVMPTPGRSLGNLIIIEDDVVEVKEEPRNQVVMTLIKITD